MKKFLKYMYSDKEYSMLYPIAGVLLTALFLLRFIKL
jgi:hypothetical protein